jgi:hypothetical protein
LLRNVATDERCGVLPLDQLTDQPAQATQGRELRGGEGDRELSSGYVDAELEQVSVGSGGVATWMNVWIVERRAAASTVAALTPMLVGAAELVFPGVQSRYAECPAVFTPITQELRIGRGEAQPDSASARPAASIAASVFVTSSGIVWASSNPPRAKVSR